MEQFTWIQLTQRGKNLLRMFDLAFAVNRKIIKCARLWVICADRVHYNSETQKALLTVIFGQVKIISNHECWMTFFFFLSLGVFYSTDNLTTDRLSTLAAADTHCKVSAFQVTSDTIVKQSHKNNQPRMHCADCRMMSSLYKPEGGDIIHRNKDTLA